MYDDLTNMTYTCLMCVCTGQPMVHKVLVTLYTLHVVYDGHSNITFY